MCLCFAVREAKRASLHLFCNDGRKDSERVQEQRVEGYEKVVREE